MSDLDASNLFDAMPIPRFIVKQAADSTFHIHRINKMAQRYFDFAKEIETSQTIHDVMDSENARHFEQSFKVCLSRSCSVTIQALPTQYSDINVQSFWVSPIYDNEGNLQYLDVLGQIDVRDQSILQRERDDAISLLASIFEVSEIGIIVTDEDGLIVRVNESFVRTYEWPRDEVVGKHFIDLIAEDEKERTRINHKKFIESGVRSTGEIKIVRKDHQVANVLFTSATLRLSQDRKFLVTTVMDISLRKKMEHSLRMAKDQADTANRAKSSFLANMSHELRTPLNAIIGFSELMIGGTFGDVENVKYKEYLDDIHMSAEHLLEIINEVLDMSKIEAGHLELYEEVFSIEGILDSVIRMMSSRVFASSIDIIPDVEDGLPDINADYRLVRQILMNLLTNAVKFSHANSKIIVSAKLNVSREIVICVQDFGIGMDAHKIKRALEPFGQINDVPERREPNHHGTGLGLPLAKTMIELHDGRFDIVSEVDVGTTVTFTLPAYRVKSAHVSE